MSENPRQSDYDAAAQVEAALIVQAENAYLKQRVVHLNVRVRDLEAEVERLTPEDEPDPDPEPDSD